MTHRTKDIIAGVILLPTVFYIVWLILVAIGGNP